MRNRSRVRALQACVAVAATAVTMLAIPAAQGSSAASTDTSTDAPGPTELPATTVTRTVTNALGVTTTVDSRQVDVSVSQTQLLQDQQRVTVTWSGAHPSDNRNYGNIYSGSLTQTEFPVVVLQCRGVDEGTQTISPQNCWTQSDIDRTPPPNQDFWTLDSNASTTQQGLQQPESTSTYSDPTNGDTSFIDDCFPASGGYDGPAASYYYMPFIAADGSTYPMCGQRAVTDDAGNTTNLFVEPPESTSSAPTGLGVQEVVATTDDDGTGSTPFEVRTADDNSSLGCSPTVPCSLVVIPIEGISCNLGLPHANDSYRRPSDGDTYQTLGQACTSTGTHIGQAISNPQATGSNGAPAVTANYWSLPSNWKNRISVALTFAPSASFCGVKGGAAPEQFFGAELAGDAARQWGQLFCDPAAQKFSFTTVSQPEFQARQEVEGSLGCPVDLGFTLAGPDGGSWRKSAMANCSAGDPSNKDGTVPVVTAPTAVTGFGIAYVMADYAKSSSGGYYYKQDYQELKLNARLLAKLVTESYNAGFTKHPGVGANPFGLFQDPEFQALNPDFHDPLNPDPATSTLLALSPISDVTKALTSYIDSDPEARAWLDGTPDPWGMVVNPSYSKISLPVSKLPLLDTTLNPDINNSSNCPQLTETPFLQEVEAPVQTLGVVAADLLNRQGDVQLGCHVGDKNVPGDVSLPTKLGFANNTDAEVLGLVSLSDAATYSLPLAQLQTYADPSVTGGAKFTDATGRAFVAPTDTSLSKAAQLATMDDAQNLWTIDSSKLNSQANDDAYPLTTIVYAAAPTKGLTTTSATRVAQFLTYAAGDGQNQGFEPGELPAGYTPMTSANGLGFLADYTAKAATAVAAQAGDVPSVDPNASPSPTPTPSPSKSPSKSASPSPSVGSSSSVSVTPSATGSSTVSASTGGGAAVGAATGASSGAGSSSAATAATTKTTASPKVSATPAPAASAAGPSVAALNTLSQSGSTPKTAASHAALAIPILLIIVIGSLAGLGLNAWGGKRR